ncbi:ATP-binding protein [Corynebacterium variabile]|uniref:ATP-binding protein n=1 Tax=Corynebacterium variabile TaxID=1727 RepID=UPI0037351FB7
MNTFHQRNITSRVENLLDEFPVVVLRGARGTGKTTLARHLADTRGARFLSADQALTGGVGRGTGVTVIDDIDRARIDGEDATDRLIAMVRAAAENTRRPGAFLLTTSTYPYRWHPEPTGLAGWTVSVPLEGYTRGEISGVRDDLVTAVVDGALAETTSAPTPTGRHELLAEGSLPADHADRYPSYISDLVTRDLPLLSQLSDPSRITALLQALAANQASELTVAHLAGETEIPASTVSTYLDLLVDLLILADIPAWTPGLSAREIRRPTTLLTDSGLAAFLGAGEDALLRGFVLAELRRQSTWTRTRFRLHTYRNGSGRAVDAVLELRDGSVLAVQVPGDTGDAGNAAADLAFLRDHLGDRFLAGIVIGPDGCGYRELDTRIHETPLSVLWDLGDLREPDAAGTVAGTTTTPDEEEAARCEP